VNAVGACGLQLYNFGQAVSIPFFTEKWRPDSFYDKIKTNRINGFHTLCLLDIKVKEQSEDNLFKGKKIYEPPRYMTVKQATEQLLECEEKRREKVFGPKSLAIAVMRIGSSSQSIASATLGEFAEIDEAILGAPLHSLVIPGTMHELEYEMALHWAHNASSIKGVSFCDYVQLIR